MKIPVKLSASLVATSLILAAAAPASSMQQPRTAAKAASKPTPELIVALTALTTQLEGLIDPDPAMRHKPLSATQKTALRNVFGSETPARLEALAPSAGKNRTQLSLPAGMHSASGGMAAWEAGTWQVESTPDNMAVDTSGSWPAFMARYADADITFRNASSTSQQYHTGDYIWLGNTQVDIGTLVVNSLQGNAIPVTFNDIRVRIAATERGDRVDQQVEFTAASVTAAGQGIDQLHLAFGVRNLDRSALRALKSANNAADAAQLTARFQELAMLGAELRIDDFSAAWRGHKIRINGTVSMPGASEADFASRQAIARKLRMRFELAAPLGLLRALAGEVASKNAKSNPMLTADRAYQALTEKLTKDGLARIDGDSVRTWFELRDGALYINGKSVTLPESLKKTLAAP